MPPIGISSYHAYSANYQPKVSNPYNHRSSSRGASAQQANAALHGGAYGAETLALSGSIGALSGAAILPATVLTPHVVKAKVAAAKVGGKVALNMSGASIATLAGIGATAGIAGAVASSFAADDPIKGAVIGGAAGGLTAIGVSTIYQAAIGASFTLGGTMQVFGIPGVIAGAVAGAVAQTL